MAIQTILNSDTFLQWKDKSNSNFTELDLNSVTIYEVADIPALLAAGANARDVGVVAGPTYKTFIHNGGVTGTIADWVELFDVVQSVAGKVGIITLNGTDISNTPAGNVVATEVQAAINELDTKKTTPAYAESMAVALG